MSVFLTTEDDGLRTRPAGPWAQDKLDYLARYINAFETSMRDKWKIRYYIDLLCGPGKNKIRGTDTVIPGSPLIALTTRYPFTHYVFVDNDPENIRALQQRCSALSRTSRMQITFLTGDCNVLVDEIVNQIQPVAGKSLNLAFLDPEGLELQWSTVEKLARLPRMDLIINYPQGGLNRCMKRAFEADSETDVDRFFGGREWRDIYEKHQRSQLPGKIHYHLLDLYKSKLEALGYCVRKDEDTGDSPLIRNAQCRAPLYRLLFASRHPLGQQFWKSIIRREPGGQKRLF